jgi:DNA polymerase-3 subunit delta'
MTLPWLQAVEREFGERLHGDRLAHALMLSGPAHCGKVDLARRFMAAALCLENRYPACGQCRSCQLLNTGAHPDGHIVTFEERDRKPGVLRTELVVGQMRRLIDRLFLTNTISPRKAALIYPVEESNASAINALLKTLEEPPSDTLIILVAHDTGRVPATVRSRCQNLTVRLPAHGDAIAWVTAQAGLSGPDAEAALEAAAGSPLRAVELAGDGGLDQFQALREALDGLREGRLEPTQVLPGLNELEPVRLWSWISLHAAALGRAGALDGRAARPLLELQRLADINRRLARSPVRGNLLLQDWLIQWARLGV